MNREQKAAAVAEIADQIKQSDAVFAVDYRGITVTQVAELRGKLRESDATFRVVKNTLTERAADEAQVESLKELLTGPTALTFVRGDAASAAKTISVFNKETELLAFKGGIMNGETLEVGQIQAIAKLPPRDVLYQQLVGVVAAPLTGLVRGLGGLIGGLAIALGQLQQKKESGEVPAGEAPVVATPQAAPAAEVVAQEAVAEGAAAPEAPAADAGSDVDAQAPATTTTENGQDPAEGADEPQAQADGETTSDNENEADASA